MSYTSIASQDPRSYQIAQGYLILAKHTSKISEPIYANPPINSYMVLYVHQSTGHARGHIAISASDPAVQIRVQEIVVRVQESEGVFEESSSCRSVCSVTSLVSVLELRRFGGKRTYTVKQSHMKLNAAGPACKLTSSGIGGA